MATLSVDNDQPVVEFTRWERPFTLRRWVRIPLTAVRGIRTQLVSVRHGTTAAYITVEPGFDGLFDEILVSAPETVVAAAVARTV